MKPSLLQEALWRLEAVAFDLFGAFFRAMPLDTASALGGGLLQLVGPLSGAHRTARLNLQIAFPELSPAERRRILHAQWGNVGRLFAEFPLMDRLTPTSGRVEVVGGERLAEIVRSGKATVLVSGHLSNWEIMAGVIAHSGVACQVTYRAANNPYIDRRIIEGRRRYGVHLLAPKGGAGSREILEAMSQGQSVALLNDQKFNNGVLAPFFGQPAHTAPGPSRLALRSGGVMQPISVQRTGGARFRVVIHEPIVIPQTDDRANDIEEGVRRINAFIEARVRERPEEWFWVHRRWPNAVYEALESPGRKT